MKATVLLAGFAAAETEEATRRLLAAGACVLQTPGVAQALAHLEGGVVQALVVSVALRDRAARLKEFAARRGVAVLVMDAPLDAAELPKLLRAALKL